MIKVTAKSNDPVQQALRDEKSVWNKRVKVFINNTINLKKMLNGHPSKFHMEKIDIKEPLPENPSAILETLLSEFNDIAQEGNKIISDQATYSANRKNRGNAGKVPETATKETQPIQQPEVVEVDLEQQLSKSPLAAEYKPKLISEASNRLSRFKAKLKGPWFGNSPEAIERKNRLALLDAAKSLYDVCGDFQVEILSTEESSIKTANQLMLRIEDEMISLIASIDLFVPKREVNEDTTSKNNKETANKENTNKETKDDTILKSTTTEQTSEYTDVIRIIKDWKLNAANLANNISMAPEMDKFIREFETLPESSKKFIAPKIIELNNRALAELTTVLGAPVNSLQDAVLKISSASENIQILAEINIKKKLRRLRHKLPFAGKTSAIRVQAYEEAELMRKTLDSMMDSLEISMDPDMLNSFTTDLLQQYDDLRKAVSILLPGEKYRGADSIYSEENQKRIKDLVNKRELVRMRDRLLKQPVVFNKPGK